MPRRKCLLPDCPSIMSEVKFHCLPCIDSHRALWLRYLLPLVPSLRSLTKLQLTRSRICRLHFEDKYIKSDGKRVGHCAPTLFTKEEIASGIPSKPLPNREQEKLLKEHSYFFKESKHTDHNYSQKINEYDQENDNISNLPDDDIGANADWPGNADEPEVPLDNLPKRTTTTSVGITHTGEPLKKNPPESQFTENYNRTKNFNEVQNFMNEFIKEIQSDIDYQAPEGPELSAARGKFADELKTYNFSSDVIMTNRYVKPLDYMENLMYSEKAYAAITFCLLRQQDLFEESIRDFLAWAAKSEINYESLKEKVIQVFENGEFIKISFKILQIICKYRIKNIEIRKEGIAKQALEPEMREALKKIPHSSSHLFNDDDLKTTLKEAPSIEFMQQLQQQQPFKIKIKPKNKHDRATQVNILPKKADKTVQVKPKKVRKAGKCVQVNTNELECIATAKKVKKKDAGSQTKKKDILLSTAELEDNPPLRERSEIIEDSLISHCQKIQYVVNIKRKPPRHDRVRILDSKVIKGPDSLESNVPAGPEHSNFSQSQNVQSNHNRIESNNQTSHNQGFHKSKKKSKSIKRAPEPSMPVLWDACQNLLSLGGRSNNETETEQVHSTLERESVTPKSPKHTRRPNFGKKRRPKIPEALKEQSSPIKSTGTSPMRGTSESLQVPGTSADTFHVCDSPYLLGGCKHTYDPQAESVPPFSIPRSQGIQRNPNYGHGGGKRRRYDIPEPSSSMYEEEVTRNLNLIESAPVVVQTQNQATADTINPSSPLLLLSYDNLLSRWA